VRSRCRKKSLSKSTLPRIRYFCCPVCKIPSVLFTRSRYYTCRVRWCRAEVDLRYDEIDEARYRQVWGVEMKEQKSPWKLCVDEMPSDNQLLYALVEKGNKKKIVLGKYINKNWELPDSNDYGPPVYWRPFNSLPGDEEIIK